MFVSLWNFMSAVLYCRAISNHLFSSQFCSCLYIIFLIELCPFIRVDVRVINTLIADILENMTEDSSIFQSSCILDLRKRCALNYIPH